MRVIVFGATGMIGQSVLVECLKDGAVTEVLAVLRSPTGRQHPKLRELIHRDFHDYSAIEAELAGFDDCFFCLGVTSPYATGRTGAASPTTAARFPPGSPSASTTRPR